jgi:hypothetical protein
MLPRDTRDPNMRTKSYMLLNSKGTRTVNLAIWNILKFPGPLRHANRFWLTKRLGSLLDKGGKNYQVCVEVSRFCKRL